MSANPLSEHGLSSAEAFHQVSTAMSEVEDLLSRVASESGPASGPINHLVASGGKRIRPRLTLLIAASCPEFRGDFPIAVAAAGELIHTASLLHDDVIDEGVQRRGIPTARVVWSNTISVLAGDHCLSSAVELIRSHDTGETLAGALAAVKDLTNGELMQLESKGSLMVDEERYRSICSLKTASLFVWCVRAGARAAGAADETLDAVGQMAEKVGLAFQIRDDLLDMTGDDRFGKRLLDDLREGRMTLPVIYAVRQNPSLGDDLAAMFEAPDSLTAERLQSFRSAVQDTGAVAAVADEVGHLTRDALDLLSILPASPYRELIDAQIELLGQRQV